MAWLFACALCLAAGFLLGVSLLALWLSTPLPLTTDRLREMLKRRDLRNP